ncbi:hypothetical protein ABBQ32_007405 [Trebouxia sp. C0010 RCD-2024]
MASQRAYDIVVFGASGFTGQRVLRELASQSQGRYAAAGRNRERLAQILPKNSVAQIEVIVAEIEDNDALLHMAQSTRLVLNCVGPYRYWGQPVVAACVEAGTDYIDVCGEPEFMELMEFRFHAKAKKNGCFVVSAAGFDSVPADLGVLYTMQQFQPPAVPSSVISFLSFQIGPAGIVGHYPTWESAVGGFGSAKDFRLLRKSIAADPSSLKPPKPVGPRPRRIPPGEYSFYGQGHAVPFPGSDASVVRRTQTRLASQNKPTVHYSAYFTVPTYFTFLLFALFGKLLETLAKFAWGRSALLRYPRLFSYGLFSREGPNEQQLAQTRFQMRFIGDAYSQGAPSNPAAQPDEHVQVSVTGPEPGYIATPIIMVQTALTLQQERDRCTALVGPGGVFTVGALFGETSLTQRLSKAGVTFEVTNKWSDDV